MNIPNIGSAFAERITGKNLLKVDVESAVFFVKNYAIQQEDIVLDSMDFYNISTDVRDGKVKFLQLTTDSYITTPKKTGCAWDPVSGLSVNLTEVALSPLQIQFEHCTENVIGWENTYGAGNDVDDLLATPFGAALYTEIITLIYSAIGNDFNKIFWLGKHPVVAQAAASWQGDIDEWNRMSVTLNASGGILTIVDKLQTEGVPHMNVQIPENEITAAGKYTGDINAFFQKMVDAMTPKFKTLVSKKRANNIKPVILVSDTFFVAYKKWLSDRYVHIPESYRFKLSDDYAKEHGLSTGFAEDILEWEGFWIKNLNAWDSVAADLQITHLRALMTVPKNLCAGLDVKEDSAHNGMGLIVEQLTTVKERGKIVGVTNYRMCTAVIDSDYIVNASYLSA